MKVAFDSIVSMETFFTFSVVALTIGHSEISRKSNSTKKGFIHFYQKKKSGNKSMFSGVGSSVSLISQVVTTDLLDFTGTTLFSFYFD